MKGKKKKERCKHSSRNYQGLPGAPFALFSAKKLLVLSHRFVSSRLAVLPSFFCHTKVTISWGRQTGRGRVACTCSRRARRWLQWCSRARRGRPRRLEIVSPDNTEDKERTYSCSTSGPACSHAPCVRIHRTSSRSADDHRIHHHRRLGKEHRRPASSCVQCGRPDRTCSIPGHRRRARESIRRWGRQSCRRYHRRSEGNRERCVRSAGIGSRISPWEGRCIRGLEDGC